MINKLFHRHRVGRSRRRGLNSPLFFYLAGTHQPEEIVINKVGKNTISGTSAFPTPMLNQ
jgi:hypothetical protein